MSRFLLAGGLILAALIGSGRAAQAGELPAAAHQAEVGVQEAALSYGPYVFYDDAVAVQNSLALRGIDSVIVLESDGFYYVYA